MPLNPLLHHILVTTRDNWVGGWGEWSFTEEDGKSLATSAPVPMATKVGGLDVGDAGGRNADVVPVTHGREVGNTGRDGPTVVGQLVPRVTVLATQVLLLDLLSVASSAICMKEGVTIQFTRNHFAAVVSTDFLQTQCRSVKLWICDCGAAEPRTIRILTVNSHATPWSFFSINVPGRAESAQR